MSAAKIRFIAYDISTAPKDPVFKDGLLPSGTYQGLDDPRQDIEARCRLMERAMNVAADEVAGGSPPDGDDVLNVFVAPEFFFRGSAGAYQMEDVSYAVTRLQELAADPVWEGWMFVFGSVLGTAVSETSTAEVYNFVLVQQGGSAAKGDAGARVVMKELKSGIDFISEEANPGGILWGDVEHLAAGSRGAGRERQQVNYDGAGVFELGDITWGLEVCLDHGARRLKRSPQLPGEKTVQVQLVPSCGMSVQPGSVVAGDGGFVFNCDGGGFGNTLNRIVLGGSPPGRTLQPVAAQPAVPVEGSDIELESPPTAVAVSELFAAGAGQVVCYPPQPSPQAKVVPGEIRTLRWRPADGSEFTFLLHYDGEGAFRSVLARIELASLDLHDHDYFVPLRLATTDRGQRSVRIELRQVAATTNGYDGALWCDIDVPGFRFEGVAFEFHNEVTGGDPYTVW